MSNSDRTAVLYWPTSSEGPDFNEEEYVKSISVKLNLAPPSIIFRKITGCWKTMFIRFANIEKRNEFVEKFDGLRWKDGFKETFGDLVVDYWLNKTQIAERDRQLETAKQLNSEANMKVWKVKIFHDGNEMLIELKKKDAPEPLS